MPWREPGWWAIAVAVGSAAVGYFGALLQRRVNLERQIVELQGQIRSLMQEQERQQTRLQSLESGQINTARALASISTSIESIGRTLTRLESKIDGKADK